MVNKHITVCSTSLVIQFSSVQSFSCVWLFATPWIAARQASLSITISQSSLKSMSIELVMPSSHLILCCPLLLLPQSLPASESFPMSQLFAWGGQSTGVSTLASIPSKEHPGLISYRMDWLDLLAVQGTLKSLLQHHSSKESALALSFLHSPTLTSIHDHWKNHSLDETDLCWQSNISAFQYAIQVGHNFSSKE